MPLQIGAWRMHSNGYDASLVISSVTVEGVVNGNLRGPGELLIAGFWNEAAQELTFTPVTDSSEIVPMFYKGFLFSSPPRAGLQPGQDFTWYLAGYLQVTDQTPLPYPDIPRAHSRRNMFGWFAQIDIFI